MLTDILLVLGLVLLNGVFAMSELAIVSSRKARLKQKADGGSAGARAALGLAEEPTRFLSSVQVGITSIGILSGAIGEASLAGPLREALMQVPTLAPIAHGLALAIVVLCLTYASLILGELVPKRLAMTHPEAVASLVAIPIEWLGRLGRPLVFLLTVTTDTILRLLRIRSNTQMVSAEEVKLLLEQGAGEGVFDASEQQMVTNVLHLDELRVAAVLTPRGDIVYLDVHDSPEELRARLRGLPHQVVPLCDGNLDQVIGIVRVARVLEALMDGGQADLRNLAEPAVFVPETMTVMRLLEQFKRAHLPIAMVVDEFGQVEGLASLTDVVSAIVGELSPDPGEEPLAVRREDGSWLIDGAVDLDSAARILESDTFMRDQDREHYHTLGGLAMLVLGRVPRTGDVFERGSFRFEVVDMDGNRVDRLLVSRPGS